MSALSTASNIGKNTALTGAIGRAGSSLLGLGNTVSSLFSTLTIGGAGLWTGSRGVQKIVDWTKNIWNRNFGKK